MNDADFLPNDLGQCQRLLLAAFREATERERRLADAERKAAHAQRQAQAALQHASESQQRVTDLGRVLDETAASFEQLRQEHAATLEELAWYKRWVHGRRSERLADGEGQGHLFDCTPPAAEAASDFELTEPLPAVARPRRRRRELDLSRLPHHRHESELSAPEKICDCCGRQKDRIGEDVTTVVEHVPPRLEVHEYVRGKYACRYCKNGVSSPPPPPRPIARGIAGPGLVAEIIVSKFGDHLPLYRQEDIFTRHGLYLPRSTLCNWVKSAAELLRPLYEFQKERVLASPLLWTDDTPVRMLDATADGGSRLARFWAYVGDDEHPYSVYDFTTSRKRDGPAQFLKDYRGALHADAYGGYDGIVLASGGEIVRIACGAHLRRKFIDARSSAPRPCAQMLEWFRQLYDLEDRARELPAADRGALRQQEAAPVLARMKAELDELSRRALPRSSLGKAVTYALNQWQAFRRYIEDGWRTIDNNISERTLRAQAIGRRNWLFLGHEDAGPRAAVLFTILAGAKRHRIEPWAYVTDVLLHLAGETAGLSSLLPDRWAAAHPEHVLTHRLEESRQKRARQQARRAHRRRSRS